MSKTFPGENFEVDVEGTECKVVTNGQGKRVTVRLGNTVIDAEMLGGNIALDLYRYSRKEPGSMVLLHNKDITIIGK